MVRIPKLAPEASVVAREVHRRMVDAGITKKRLALDSGLGETYVHDLFRGKSMNPQSEHLAKLAKGLKCEVSDLTHPAGASEKPKISQNIDPSDILPLFPSDVAMIRLWKRLPKYAKDLVLMRITELLPRHLRPSDDDT
jgi:transcriptional regulator with XRE-family HTH domain